MSVNRVQLMNELRLKIENDAEAKRDFKVFCDEVKDYWQHLAPDGPTSQHPWSTGAYHDSIQRFSERDRDSRGRFMYHHWVATYDPIAHLLEYGTGPDDAPNYPKPPKAGGNWFDLDGEHHTWWNTPTPAFAFAARTAAHFGGTAP